jgi:ketosteroid isomerase-like protein
MSRENVEIVRRWSAAWSANPEEALAASAEFFDAEFDYYPVRKWPEAQPCHGLEEFSQFLTRFEDAFSRHEWAIQEVIEVGDDRVFVRVNMRTEGRGSGMTLEGDLYQCFWLRHGRFFRIEDHLTLRGALHALGLQGETFKAAGLKEYPMSQENMELTRRFFEAWNAGDMDAIREQYDPAIVVRYTDDWPEGSEPAMGREAVMRWMEQLRSTWDASSLEPISFIDLGDRVIVRQILRAVGHGPDLNLEVTVVTTRRKGKAILIEFFWNHADALEAVGLSEQDAHVERR